MLPLLLAGLAGIGAIGAKFARDQMQAQDLLRFRRHWLSGLEADASAAYTDLEGRRAPVRSHAGLALGGLHPDDPTTTRIATALDDEQSAFGTATDRQLAARSRGLDEEALTADFEALRRGWNDALTAHGAAASALDALQEVIDGPEALLAEIGESHAQLTDRLRRAGRAIEEAAAQSFQVDRQRERLQALQQQAQVAATSQTEGRLTDARDQMVQALRDAESLLTQSEDMPRALSSATAALDLLRERRAAVGPAVDLILDQVLAMRETYAEVVWETVSDTPAAAAGALKAATATIEDAARLLAERDVTQAQIELAQAGAALTMCEQMTDGVRALSDEVASAEAELPSAVREARESLERAQRITSRRQHHDRVVAVALSQAEANLGEANWLMSTRHPDPVRALAKVRAVIDVSEAASVRTHVPWRTRRR